MTTRMLRFDVGMNALYKVKVSAKNNVMPILSIVRSKHLGVVYFRRHLSNVDNTNSTSLK